MRSLVPSIVRAVWTRAWLASLAMQQVDGGDGETRDTAPDRQTPKRPGSVPSAHATAKVSIKLSPDLIVDAAASRQGATRSSVVEEWLLLVVPCTTLVREAPTHVLLRRGEGGVSSTSALKCEQLTTLPRSGVAVPDME